jgi:ankyrin repeat protein
MSIQFGDNNCPVPLDVFSIIMSMLDPKDFLKASAVCKSWRNFILSSNCQTIYQKYAEKKYEHLHLGDHNHQNQIARLAFTIRSVQKLTKASKQENLRNRKKFVLEDKFPSPFDVTKYKSSEYQARIQFQRDSFNYWINNREPSGYDVNARDRDENTPLMVKAKKGKFHSCRELIKNGANPNVTNRIGCTPLHLAIPSGSLKTVKVLLDAGARVNGGKFNDISNAIKYGKYEIAKLLVDYVDSPVYVWIDLFELLAEGQDELIVCLIKKGKTFRETLLHAAVEKNSVEVVEALIKAGANMDSVRDKYGDSPLDIAIRLGLTDIVEMMIEAGALPNERSYAIAKLYWPGLISLQTILKNDFSYTTDYSFDYDNAVVKGNLSYLENDYKIGVREFDCLEVAANYDHLKIIEFLIKAGDHVNDRYYKGRTALIHAVMNGRFQAAKLLIQHGADPNIKDKFGFDAMFYAKKYWPDDVELIHLLNTKRRKKRA